MSTKLPRPKTGQPKKRGRPPGTTRPPSTPAAIRRAERKGEPRGRVPEIAAGVNCTVRLPAEIVAVLDLWAAKADGATRSAAIRHCVMAFFAEKTP